MLRVFLEVREYREYRETQAQQAFKAAKEIKVGREPESKDHRERIRVFKDHKGPRVTKVGRERVHRDRKAGRVRSRKKIGSV